MGIFDDMENFILDQFSVMKRQHNVQQVIEISNGQQRSGQQVSSSSQQVESRSGAPGRQLMSMTSQEVIEHTGSPGTPTRPQMLSMASQDAGDNQGPPGTPTRPHLRRFGSHGRLDHVGQQMIPVGHQGVSDQVLRHVNTAGIPPSSPPPVGPSGPRVTKTMRSSSTSELREVHRSPQASRGSVPSSPFRERMSWCERPGTPQGMSELHRSPPLERYTGICSPTCSPSPFRSRQRASWVEQSNLNSVTDLKRGFSFDQQTSPGLRRNQRSATPSERRQRSATPSERRQRTPQSEQCPSNSPFRVELARSSQSDSPSINSIMMSNGHRRSSMSEAVSLPITNSEVQRAQQQNQAAQYSGQTIHHIQQSPRQMPKSQQQQQSQLSGAHSSQSTHQQQHHQEQHQSHYQLSKSQSQPQAQNDVPPEQQQNQLNIDLSLRQNSKPKLVRLRSEPSPSTSGSHIHLYHRHNCSPLPGGDYPSHWTQPDMSSASNVPHEPAPCCSRRRHEELKRSQSFEVTSPSCQETALWTGINLPNQLVITRPQLCRSRLNRKHLSLHLDGVSGDLISLRPDTQLQFHDTHGDNIELLMNKTRARRYESFCKGICFSNRPIAINERVYVKFVETNTSWSGVLRFGFTCNDPATIRGCDLPRYACPDLTNKPGNWAKALGERYTTSNILLHFSVNHQGDVFYGVNGEEKGLFFSGVVTTQPLWAMLDIYGNTVGVEFSHANAEIEAPANASQFDESPQPVPRSMDTFNFSNLALETPASPTAAGPLARMRYHQGVNLTPLKLHQLQGRNVRVSQDRTVAVRLREEYCNAFVFSSRPIACGETVIIQVLGIDRSYIGGLGFGLTACDPATVNAASLPDDSDLLLDRPEYWVVNKDVCRDPEVGDELSFFLSPEGEVRYARNNLAPVTLMFVDRTLPLWAFFDVYGNIQKVKIHGTTKTQVQGRLNRSQSGFNIQPGNRAGGPSTPASGTNNQQRTVNSSGLTVALPPSSNQGPPQRPPSLGQPPANFPPPVSRSNSVPVSCLATPPQGFGENPPVPSPQHPTSLPSSPLSPTAGGQQEDGSSDCKVCWERSINCVLYTCGHMCLCYDCALTIRSQKGLCPICRQAILDVIKIYRS